MAISCRICFILFAHNYTVNPCFNSPCDTLNPHTTTWVVADGISLEDQISSYTIPSRE